MLLFGMSAREIKQEADKIIKKNIQNERNQQRVNQELNQTSSILIMIRLGISLDRIARRLDMNRKTVSELSDRFQWIKNELNQGRSIPECAKKLSFPEPLIWSIALEEKTDQERFKALNWGLLTWDHWYWNDVDHRFGDDWPGRIPAQLVAHTLFYFSRENQLVFDPMAGGGVVPDICLIFHRRCWSFDLVDRVKTRPEIECYHWNPADLKWPIKSRHKPDLIFIDPPYFKKMEGQYSKDSISSLSRKEYLTFFKELFLLIFDHSTASARLAFLNADWRDFQGIPALEEDRRKSIFITDYSTLLSEAGWEITQFIDCPMSSQRFHAGIVSQMQQKRILGITRRTLIIARKG